MQRTLLVISSVCVISASATSYGQVEVPLTIQSWTWTTRHNYIHAEGAITNNTQEHLRYIKAHLLCYTADDMFVQSESSLVDYHTLMPGQMTPFSIIMNTNPAIKKCSLQFSTEGEQIMAVKAPEPPPRNPSLDGKNWFMTDDTWFAFQASQKPECKAVPIMGFDGAHEPTIIRWVQQRLNELGFDTGEPDGKNGPKTENAIKRYAASLGKEFGSKHEAALSLIPNHCFTRQVKDTLGEF